MCDLVIVGWKGGIWFLSARRLNMNTSWMCYDRTKQPNYLLMKVCNCFVREEMKEACCPWRKKLHAIQYKCCTKVGMEGKLGHHWRNDALFRLRTRCILFVIIWPVIKKRDVFVQSEEINRSNMGRCCIPYVDSAQVAALLKGKVLIVY